MKIENVNFNSNFEKLLVGLTQDDDVTNYSVYKKTETIHILVGDFCLELNNDGTWSIG